MEEQKARINQETLGKKTKVEGFALPDLKTYYKTAVIN